MCVDTVLQRASVDNGLKPHASAKVCRGRSVLIAGASANLCSTHTGAYLCSTHTGACLCSTHTGACLCSTHTGACLCSTHTGVRRCVMRCVLCAWTPRCNVRVWSSSSSSIWMMMIKSSLCNGGLQPSLCTGLRTTRAAPKLGAVDRPSPMQNKRRDYCGQWSSACTRGRWRSQGKNFGLLQRQSVCVGSSRVAISTQRRPRTLGVCVGARTLGRGRWGEDVGAAFGLCLGCGGAARTLDMGLCHLHEVDGLIAGRVQQLAERTRQHVHTSTSMYTQQHVHTMSSTPMLMCTHQHDMSDASAEIETRQRKAGDS